GKAEIVRAALNGIAYQIYDVLEAMEKDAGMPIDSLRVDGGASSNGYLMQFQSDILACSVQRAQAEELSAAGAAYMAGIAAGVCTDDVFSSYSYRAYSPEISDEARQKLLSGWRGALKMVISAAK
ncbi:MAG: glycerol kinase, partial [Clostridia bacterium]|nr:glycerol kinase [Clostridia bacterium]